jgi:predicted nucleic acid-binding protein
MAGYTALYDACVLYPAPLRDLLLQLAQNTFVRARWSDRIHEEWMRNVLANRPDLTAEQLHRTRSLMDAAVPDARVSNYEKIIPSLHLPDPDDRHVLAAAIRGRCDVIVTYNLKDFPASALKTYDITVLHPDQFFAYFIGLYPTDVCASAKACRARLKRPPIAASDYILTIAAQKLPETARFLQTQRTLI